MNKQVSKTILPAIICVVVMSIVCGIIYPLAVTAVGQVAFPKQANGGIITVTLPDGTQSAVGSEYVAQTFTQPKYLIGRPQTEAGSPTNLSPVSPEQAELVEQRMAAWHALDPENTAEIPMDLLTVSGSGVDPHISPEAALYQADRIARERAIPVEQVLEAIDAHTDGRSLGVLGEPVVNVLMVNLQLDGLL